MKHLVLLTAKDPTSSFAEYEEAEQLRVWTLYQHHILTEIYLLREKIGAVIILSAKDHKVAEEIARSLPMVQAGLFHVEVLGLEAWVPLAKTFQHNNKALPEWWPSSAGS